MALNIRVMTLYKNKFWKLLCCMNVWVKTFSYLYIENVAILTPEWPITHIPINNYVLTTLHSTILMYCTNLRVTSAVKMCVCNITSKSKRTSPLSILWDTYDYCFTYSKKGKLSIFQILGWPLLSPYKKGRRRRKRRTYYFPIWFCVAHIRVQLCIWFIFIS